jgi:hypothetical protein
MSIPTSRDEFKEYTLRALGKPVLQINVDDSQVEDRIDEAIYLYQQFHMDAVVKTYMKHRITPSVLRFAGPATGAFKNGESIIGATSGVTAGLNDVRPKHTKHRNFLSGRKFPQNTNTISDNSYSDTAFAVGFPWKGSSSQDRSGATATIFTSNSSVQAYHAWRLRQSWIPIPTAVISITKVFTTVRWWNVAWWRLSV